MEQIQPLHSKSRRTSRINLAVGILSCAATAGSTSLIVLGLTTSSYARQFLSPLGIAAGGVNLVTMFLHIAFMIISNGTKSRPCYRRTKVAVLAACLLLVISGAALSFTYLSFLAIRMGKATRRTQSNLRLLIAALAICSVAIAAQIAFYAMLFYVGSLKAKIGLSAAPDRFDERRDMAEQTLKLSLAERRLIGGRQPALRSPSLSLHSVGSMSSWRASVLSAGRPSKESKGRSPNAQSLDARLREEQSNKLSSSPSVRGGGASFDDWECRQVIAWPQDSLDRSSTQLRQTILEPIPASRPPTPLIPELFSSSPAPRPSAPASPISTVASKPSMTFASRPPSRACSSPVLRSRASTNTFDESHIHPLFRSDSTEPPPLATRSTVILASPFCGHSIPASPTTSTRSRSRSYSHASHSRRAAGKSPLIPSEPSSPFIIPEPSDYSRPSTPSSYNHHTPRSETMSRSPSPAPANANVATSRGGGRSKAWIRLVDETPPPPVPKLTLQMDRVRQRVASPPTTGGATPTSSSAASEQQRGRMWRQASLGEMRGSGPDGKSG